MSIPRIANAFTRLLDIQIPVICAPMAMVTCPKLVTQAILGGGYGFLAAGYQSTQRIRDEISEARSLLASANYKPNSPKLPIGVAYFGWELEKNGNELAREKLDISLDNNVESIWLSFGNELGNYVKYIRQKERESDATRKTNIFVVVSTVEEALAAAKWSTDVIVAQGYEAGGHGSPASPPIFSFVTSILRALSENHIPIIAAGGFSNGAQVASMLSLGASGVALGTRFILTPESLYSDAQKSALLAAESRMSVRSIAFDQARGTVDWPPGIDGRGLYNKIVEDFNTGKDIKQLREKVTANAKGGDLDYLVTWGGVGVGEMREIKGAKTLMQDFHREIIERLRRTQSLIADSRDKE